MFKFLKGVEAGSGAGIKDFPYNIGEPYSSAWGSWTHHRGTNKKEANEKLLAALNSVVKCLKDHKLDATKLASLKIDQKIAKCEKEILNGELKLHDEHVKRKLEDVDTLKNLDSQSKQLRPSPTEASHGPLPQSVRQTQGQGTSAINDSGCPYNVYTANKMYVSSEASHGLVDKNSMGLLAQNVHENTVYQNSVETSHGQLPQSVRQTKGQGTTVYHNSVEASHSPLPQLVRQTQGQGTTAIYNSRYPYNGNTANKMHVSSEASHGLVNRNSMGLPAQNVHRNTVNQNSVEQSLSGTYHQDMITLGTLQLYQPPASRQNIYQPPMLRSGQNFYQAHASGGRNVDEFDNSFSKLPIYIENVMPKASTVINRHHQASYPG